MPFTIGGNPLKKIIFGNGSSSSPVKFIRVGTGTSTALVWQSRLGPGQFNPSIWLPFDATVGENRGSTHVTLEYTNEPGITLLNDTSIPAAKFDSARIRFLGAPDWASGGCVAMWIRDMNFNSPGGKEFFHRAPADKAVEMWLSVDPAIGKLYGGIKYGNTSWSVTAPDDAPKINDARLHHIACDFYRDPFQTTTVSFGIWVDGVRVASESRTGISTAINFSGYPSHVGGNLNGPSWSGIYDDFLLFNSAGTNIIPTLYNEGRG